MRNERVRVVKGESGEGEGGKGEGGNVRVVEVEVVGVTGKDVGSHG